MGGFKGTFLSFAAILTVAVCVSAYFLPSSLNANPAKKPQGQQQAISAKQVTYWEILKIPRALFCIVCVMFAMIFTVFMTGYLTEFLTDDFKGLGFEKSHVGYFFSLWAFFYTISAFFVGPLAKKYSTKKISFCSYLMIGVACLIFGPSHVLKFDTYQLRVGECSVEYNDCIKDTSKIKCKENFDECRGEAGAETIGILIVSLILLGSAAGTVVVPILLELVQSVKDALGVKPGANERGSALFTMGSALGSIVGNWVGGALYKEFKNPITCDIMAAMSFTMGILYFLMNIWPGFLVKSTDTSLVKKSNEPVQGPLASLLSEEHKKSGIPGQPEVPNQRYSLNPDSSHRQSSNANNSSKKVDDTMK